MPKGLLDGLDAGSGRAQNGRASATLGILGQEQIAIKRVVAVYLQLDEIAVYLIGCIFLGRLLRVAEVLLLPHLTDAILPEGGEIGWFLRPRTYLIYREAHLDMMHIGGAVYSNAQSEIAKARRGACAHIYLGPSVLQFHAAMVVGIQHVIGYGVFHNTVAWNAILIEFHLYYGFFTRFIEPVGMVGHRYEEVIAAVRIVFGTALSQCQ